jgi:hypothetical protein
MEKRTYLELIEDLTEVLLEFSGESLAELAGNILAKNVEFNYDENDGSFFTVE